MKCFSDLNGIKPFSFIVNAASFMIFRTLIAALISATLENVNVFNFLLVQHVVADITGRSMI